MNSSIKNTVSATELEPQYDENAKKLLSHKEILAHILVKTVKEFKGMNPKHVARRIEGEPEIGSVPMEPGMTNRKTGERTEKGELIVGFNTENSEINEGLVKFDIVFYVRMKDGISQIIVNVEAQKDEPTNYGLLNRAIFYVSRLISSQKERDFKKDKYDDIKRVVSIWICVNMPENSITNIHLTEDKVLGTYSPKGKMDMLNMVFIGVKKEDSETDAAPCESDELDEEYELHRLLGVLFSEGLTEEIKLGIMETEYDIPMKDSIREEVNDMCNLGEGIRERAEARGEARGRAEGEARGRDAKAAEIIIKMHQNGYPIEDITKIVDKTEEEIQAILDNAIHAPA